MTIRRIISRDGMKKKIVLISLITVCILTGLLCYKTWFAAFFITKLLSGRAEGKQGIVRSIVIPWRDYRLHLHHWLLALALGIVFVVRGFYVVTPEVFYGFLSAAVFQGIYCYGDWYRIVKRKRILPSLEEELASCVGLCTRASDVQVSPNPG
jgi:hypothetical protein